MSFYSTRGGVCCTASQAILSGLSRDGGLFVPSMFPQISMERMSRLLSLSYQEKAARIIRDYLEDYSISEIENSVNAAYTEDSWDAAEITPLKELSGNVFVMELFHGPTLAFKDVALKMLPHLVSLAAQKNEEKREISIIVATSGDTGKAALEGFKDVPNTSCTVFYPYGGVSKIQELQMNTTGGANTRVIGVRGNFDQAQTGVKKLFGSDEFKAKMDGLGKVPNSANSINFGRLLPQIVYYFSGYLKLVEQNKIRIGQSVNFVVPTGNFGDILAGYYAKRMGLPIARLLCASNRNNVLTDFFADGTYYTNRAFFKTLSPSMDILVSSNLERLLFEITDRDAELVRQWMHLLSECGSFTIGDQRSRELKKLFWADYADDFMTVEEIKRVYNRVGYVMDPHTAVASHVLHRYREATGDQTNAIILSTASPYKFCKAVVSSLKGAEALAELDDFACAELLENLSGVPMPKQVRELQSLPVRHHTVCDPEKMGETLLSLF